MKIQDWFPLGLTGWISLQSKSLLQHHNSKASILQHSALFMVPLSHPYMTSGKTVALTRWTFVGKVTSLLFNMLSRLVIVFLPRSKCLLIAWLQSPSAVILEPKRENKAVHLHPLLANHNILTRIPEDTTRLLTLTLVMSSGIWVKMLWLARRGCIWTTAVRSCTTLYSPSGLTIGRIRVLHRDWKGTKGPCLEFYPRGVVNPSSLPTL